MARFIDAEILKRNIRVNLMPNVDFDGLVTVENAERYFLNLIEKTSTADVVEVVRCKDCRMFVDNKEALVTYCTRECKSLTVNPDDFCSYGERKKTNEQKQEESR